VYVFRFVTSADTTSGRRRRWAAPALTLAAVLALGACGPGDSGDAGAGRGGHGGDRHGDDVPLSVLPSKPSKPMTVQQLAQGVGCDAKLAGKFADYRLASCEYQGRNLVMVDFDTEKNQSDWLELSKDYGGVYLVGERWVMTGNTLAEMSPLQDKFGGKLEQGDIHGPAPSSPSAK
jgi:hypothetical protein